jgi:glycosyltransferase involved in cell wall biosynthesis
MANVPKISVILPVYNSEKYLEESINSILKQTFRDFELIIINDGSTDSSKKIIESVKDERIVFVDQPNAGLAETLNRGMELAKASYIARQDNDDISDARRLEKQFKCLEEHKDIGLLGTRAVIMNEKGQPTGIFHDHPETSAELKFFLLFDNPFVHSSVMFRKSLVQKLGGYSSDAKVFEDHNLWSRIARVANVANLPERLLKYRQVQAGMSQNTGDYHARVKNQSTENLRYYSRRLSNEEMSTFINYHFCLQGNEKGNVFSFYKDCLTKIAEDFCEKEHITFSKIESQYNYLVHNFRRKFYHAIVTSQQSTPFTKFKTKVVRKLFFIFNPHLK